MGSTAHHLTKAAVDGQLSLTQLLRQTKWIVSRLGIKDVEEWLVLELQGYPEECELPVYRKVFTQGLEIYNAEKARWQSAGKLEYAFSARQPLAEIEKLCHVDRSELPVSKNFSIKNDFGDSFGSDWPQRFVVAGTEYNAVLEGVVKVWAAEFDRRGLTVTEAEKFISALQSITGESKSP